MKILVLAGGTSTERDVSLVTGSQIYKALKTKNHQVVLVDSYYGIDDGDIDKIIADSKAEGNNKYESLFASDYDFACHINGVKEENPDIDEVIKNRPKSDDGYFGPNVLGLCKASDVVFMGLHGENGENGKIQAVFDLLEIKYTGTGYLSSALSMDKGLTKSVFINSNIPTPEYFLLKPGAEIKYPDNYPVVVKTACGGSSIGVYIVNSRDEYDKAVKEAFSYKSDIVVEQYIKGREFSIGVVDGEAYPIIEIAPISGFYDYKNKYQSGSTIETCPADLPEDVTKKMQNTAKMAYEALGMKSYARMDFMMDDKYNFFCLEANTLPGMTPTSLLPQEAAAKGEDFATLCEKLVKVSLKN